MGISLRFEVSNSFILFVQWHMNVFVCIYACLNARVSTRWVLTRSNFVKFLNSYFFIYLFKSHKKEIKKGMRKHVVALILKLSWMDFFLIECIFRNVEKYSKMYARSIFISYCLRISFLRCLRDLERNETTYFVKTIISWCLLYISPIVKAMRLRSKPP